MTAQQHPAHLLTSAIPTPPTSATSPASHEPLNPFVPAAAPLLWDVFCRVIDNFGDIGVCWRLAVNLAARGQQVRLWVDDTSALRWIAPGALEGAFAGITVIAWEQPQQAAVLQTLAPADVWVETFGCEIAPEFIASRAGNTRATGQFHAEIPVWINLEHITAEGYAQRCHTLPSPLMQGPAAGWSKHFFYPGFTEGTGGLLREPDLTQQQARFDRAQWLASQGIAWQGERLVSLFCYEPDALHAFVQQLRADPTPTRLLVTAGRAAVAMRALESLEEKGPQPAYNVRNALSISYLPWLTQPQYDQLLWACDLNCVRGEDSVVRALWAGKPLVWHIYPQEDQAHHAKLKAFLDMLPADAALRQLHYAWNGLASEASAKTLAQAQGYPKTIAESPPKRTALSPLPLDQWQSSAHATRTRLLAMDDLATQLIRFALNRFTIRHPNKTR